MPLIIGIDTTGSKQFLVGTTYDFESKLTRIPSCRYSGPTVPLRGLYPKLSQASVRLPVAVRKQFPIVTTVKYTHIYIYGDAAISNATMNVKIR